MSFWFKGTRASSCDSTDAAEPGVTVKREELADSYNVSHDRPGGAREWRVLLQVWTRQDDGETTARGLWAGGELGGVCALG